MCQNFLLKISKNKKKKLRKKISLVSFMYTLKIKIERKRKSIRNVKRNAKKPLKENKNCHKTIKKIFTAQ